jgi:hypothetical protein
MNQFRKLGFVDYHGRDSVKVSRALTSVVRGD